MKLHPRAHAPSRGSSVAAPDGTPARAPGRTQALAAAAWGVATLIWVVLVWLAAASLLALVTVRVGADLLAGIDPLTPPERRPFLGAVTLAQRELAVDVARQAYLVLVVLGAARWRHGTAWRVHLALDRARPNGLPPLALLPLLLLWPVLHIAWVEATAQVFGVGFARGVHLSPLLSTAAVGVWLAYVTVLAPTAEELLMRGEAFARARAVLPALAAIGLTALMFAAAHVSPTQLSLQAFARPTSLLPLALMLGWLRWRTGRLWPCIALHGWSNLTLIVYVLWPN